MRRISVLLLCTAGACATGERRFPLREPMWRDTDLDAMAAPCRTDDKGRKVCSPELYTSSFAWDGADNMLFRPLTRVFAVDPAGPAANVNSFDEVPDSSWFVNRIGVRPLAPGELARGSCGDVVIDADSPDGSWLIDQGKANGANPGFRVKLPDGHRYMLKLDTAVEPERATGATAIASRLYHAAGWWTACDTVVYVRPSQLQLVPGLTITDNHGVTRSLDEKLLEELLAGASRRDGKIRFAASSWLPGRILGPFTYAGTADDEPGDIIPHEDRRDLRGARLIAAWLNHFDSREQNSMRTWIAANDTAPGHVIHWYMDLGDCFGSLWDNPEIARRMGHAYYLDFSYLVSDFVTFGFVERPWGRAQFSDGGEIFGYYNARDFEPEKWKGGYPNPAFERMTEADGAWAARILSRFTDEIVAEAVAVGDFTDPRHSAYLTRQLILRRDAISRRYFANLSPLADVRVEGPKLCATDLARRSGVFAETSFAYSAGGRRVAVGPAGSVCVELGHSAPDGGPADDAEERYRTIDIQNGQAPGVLRAHLYDLGPRRGFVLVGIERPEADMVAGDPS